LGTFAQVLNAPPYKSASAARSIRASRTLLAVDEVRMLPRTIELLSGLFSIALISLIAFCVFGSVVAAIRAVGRDGVTSTNSRGVPATGVLHHPNGASIQENPKE